MLGHVAHLPTRQVLALGLMNLDPVLSLALFRAVPDQLAGTAPLGLVGSLVHPVVVSAVGTFRPFVHHVAAENMFPVGLL